MLWGFLIELHLTYFCTVLETLQEHQATLMLPKTKFLPAKPEFVAVQLKEDGNLPAESTFDGFKKIPPPKTWGNLSMLIGMFSFYSLWIALFEVCIQSLQVMQGKCPKPGEMSVEEQCELMKKMWSPKDDVLLDTLRQDVLRGPILAHSNPDGLFVLKTNWSNVACGAVLCQANPNHPNTLTLVQAVMSGEKCPFDLLKSGPHLHQIGFISHKTTDAKKSYHLYIGKA